MYNITFQQIEVFITVARCQNMSRAAESLYISQPTLSKSLQRFESGIGYQVFTRSNQGVSLTPAGEYLYTTLEALYNGMDKAIGVAKEMSGKENKMLRMLVPSSYDMVYDFCDVKEVIQRFEDTYADVSIIPQLCDFVELRRQLEFGEADVAFAHEFVVENMDGIESVRVADYPLYLTMSEDFPLAKMEEIDPEILNDTVVFTVKQVDENKSREGVKRQCSKIGFTPKKVELVDNVYTMMHMLRAKRGICICGKFEDGSAKGLKFYPVSELLGPTYIVAAWHKDKKSKQLDKLIKMLPSNKD